MHNGDGVVVVGAGPAGLTAAYELVKSGVGCTVVEATADIGGLSQTVERDGWRFDIGGHRFFTKVPEVEALWHEILPDSDFLLRPRMSRIHYAGRLYDYPLKATNALRNLGLVEAVRCVLSYLLVRVRPPRDQSHFEGWVAARFGWRLYRTFFKTYTEKVWGVPATDIQADWAAQRIKNLSLWGALVDAVRPTSGSKDVTSLIEEFQYPRLGPGLMWERCAQRLTGMGGELRTSAAVVAMERDDVGVHAVVVRTPDGVDRLRASSVISSMPLGELVEAMEPAAPVRIQQAARALRHRDFLTVALVVPQHKGFPDNWIYIHSPEVRVGRVQNYGSWSPDMVKPGMTCLGLEYFVEVGDDLWCRTDDELVALARQELDLLGLVEPEAVEHGYVVRMAKAYPVYDEQYRDNVELLRRWLEAAVPNVQTIGRNGLHRYNNQDHSMVTALLAARNVVSGSAEHDVWSVNVDEDYHERDTRQAGTGRDAPVLPTGGRRPAA